MTLALVGLCVLSQERVRELFDYRGGELYWKKSPCNRVKSGAKAGTKITDLNRYSVIRINSKAYLAHRMVYLYHNKELPRFLDHIDGDPSNNKIRNLRPCTTSENAFNSKIPQRNTSGIKGVYFDKRTNKWVAQIKIKGNTLYLGSFVNLKDAETVVRAYREQHCGAFTRHA